MGFHHHFIVTAQSERLIKLIIYFTSKMHVSIVINIGKIIPQLFIQCVFTLGSSKCIQHLFIHSSHGVNFNSRGNS